MIVEFGSKLPAGIVVDADETARISGVELSELELRYAASVFSLEYEQPAENSVEALWADPVRSAEFSDFMEEEREARQLLRRLRHAFVQEPEKRRTIKIKPNGEDSTRVQRVRVSLPGRITKKKHFSNGDPYNDWRTAPRPEASSEILSDYIGRWHGNELDYRQSESLTFVAVDPQDKEALAVLNTKWQKVTLASIVKNI